MALRYSSQGMSGWPRLKLTIVKADVSNTQKWLRKQCEELAERAEGLMKETAEKTRDFAQEHYDEAYYAGEHDVTVNVIEQKNHTYAVVAEGDSLPYIEFGAKNGGKPWYFSTVGKNPTTRSGRLKGGVYAYRRGPRLDDPKKTYERNKKASSGKFTERILRNPKTGHEFSYDRMEEELYKRYPEKEAKKRLKHIVNTWETVSGKQDDARFKKYKAQYGKPEQTDEAVRTYGNPPHHYMSRAFEEAKDQIDREIGRL